MLKAGSPRVVLKCALFFTLMAVLPTPEWVPVRVVIAFRLPIFPVQVAATIVNLTLNLENVYLPLKSTSTTLNKLTGLAVLLIYRLDKVVENDEVCV